METIYPSFFLILLLLFGCNSPKKIFEAEVQQLMPTNSIGKEIISEEKISDLPKPVQRYISNSGFVGQPLSEVTEILWKNSKIKLGTGQSWRELKTRQFNFTETGSRLAYMNSRMAVVIPFEGRDRYHNGQGHMLGTLGRTFKVFDYHNREVALGGAVIVLAESLLEPSIALQEYITWEPIDDHTAGASLHHGNITVSGIFRFNEAGEFIRFESNDRPFEVSSRVYELTPFSIVIGEYHEFEGIRIPGRVFATWHLKEEDFTYWDGRITGLRRNVTRTSTSGSVK